MALFVIKVLPLFLPIQYARKELPQNTGEYWVVEGQKVTGYNWRVIGDQSGLYSKDSKNFRDINLIGNKPLYNFNDTGGTENNIFICYGEIVYDPPKRRPNTGNSAPPIAEYVLNVRHWEIMYPIKRGLFSGAILPKNYLCLFDAYRDKHYSFGEMLKGLYIWNYKTIMLP